MEYSKNAHLVRMIQNMLHFGSAESFSGQHGERFLQSFVNYIANNTRIQRATYTQELVSRIWEKEIIGHAYKESVAPYLEYDTTQKAPIVTTRLIGKNRLGIFDFIYQIFLMHPFLKRQL